MGIAEEGAQDFKYKTLKGYEAAGGLCALRASLTPFQREFEVRPQALISPWWDAYQCPIGGRAFNLSCSRICGLSFGQILYEPGETIRQVYFPADCLISLLTAVDKRRTLEVGQGRQRRHSRDPRWLGRRCLGKSARLCRAEASALRMSSTRPTPDLGRARHEADTPTR